jgi:hypothetical protein
LSASGWDCTSVESGSFGTKSRSGSTTLLFLWSPRDQELNTQSFIMSLETVLVMKCRKGGDMSLRGTTTFIPNSHLVQTPSLPIDIESITTTDGLPPRSERTRGLVGVHAAEEPRWGLSKDTEVCPSTDFEKIAVGRFFICLICHDMTNNTAGLGTEY